MTDGRPGQAETLRKTRLERRMTQRHLAAAALVSPKTVMRVEAGEGISAENLRSICSVLGLEAASLAAPGRTGVESPPTTEEKATTLRSRIAGRLRAISWPGAPSGRVTGISAGAVAGMLALTAGIHLSGYRIVSHPGGTASDQAFVHAMQGLDPVALSGFSRQDASDASNLAFEQALRQLTESDRSLLRGFEIYRQWEGHGERGRPDARPGRRAETVLDPDPSEVASWTAGAVSRALSMDFARYRASLDAASAMFTRSAWDAFEEQLRQGGLLERIIAEKLVMQADASIHARSIQGGAVDGMPAWRITLPVRFSFQSRQSSTASNGQVEAVVRQDRTGRLRIARLVVT